MVVYALTLTIGISSGSSYFMGIYDTEEKAKEIRDKHSKKTALSLSHYAITPIKVNKEFDEIFQEW